MLDSQFASAANCIDGRVQAPVAAYLTRNYGVKFVDMITEPGINLILAENADSTVVENIKKRLGVSVYHHGSRVIAIVGHPDCGGNPANKEDQILHLRQAQKTVESFGFPVEIILLWVNEDWDTVELIAP